MSVSLIVVNFHSAKALGRMLATVQYVDEIVVVDHSDSEDEVAALKNLGIDHVVSQPNGGYGAGLNRGVKESHGDILLLANPDLLLRPGTVQALVRALNEPEAGVAGPQLTWDEAGRWSVPQAPNTMWWSEVEGRYSLWTARRRYLKEQLRLWQSTSPVTTSLVSGTLMAVRRSTFLAAGGFDPKFFLFYEENDFCMRVRRLGLQPVVVPDARVCHAIGVSADQSAAGHFGPSLERFRRLWMPIWYTSIWPDPMPLGRSKIRSLHPSKAGESARWIISPSDRFMPIVQGPLVVDADPGSSDFLPAPAARSWVLGIREGLRVKSVRNL